ncbi:H-X9-DG-CTERM domain-containing protein [Abditibacterium utsteinense]|nr:H-X9-DG-CTERM domain-containing protein [Abditibacterium utsteinense]
MLGIQLYAGDYDEKYPLVATGPKAGLRKVSDNSSFGWVDTLFPYGNMMSVRIFQCPSEQTDPTKNDPPSFQTEGQSTDLQNQQQAAFPEHDPTQSQFTDYWFNARLAGKRDSELQDWKRTIAIGEGNDGTDATNARYHLLEIPRRWRKDEKSPLYRHLIGANFAFADGHVKFIGAKNWKNGLDSEDSSKATLRLKPLTKPTN